MAEVKRNIEKKKPKVNKPSRIQVKSIEYNYIGSEPIDISIKGYTSALNWYVYMCDQDQACDWLYEYLAKNDYSKTDIAYAKKAPKYSIPATVGWIARMRLNGNDLDNDAYFNSRIESIINAGKSASRVKDEVTPTPSIQDRTKNKISQVMTMIVEELDTHGHQFSVYAYLKENEIPASYVGPIRAYYIKTLDEVMSDDPQVKEAFGKKLAAERKYWTGFIDDLDRFVGNVKATKVRKPREKKVKSAVEIVKNLKFLKESPDLKMVSVNPAEIVGASQIWVYHVGYKKLTRYTAEGPSGLSVNSNTLTGFSVEHSITKSVRKPDITLNELLKAGKISLRKFMETLKTNETVPSGRFNDQTLILRVIK